MRRIVVKASIATVLSIAASLGLAVSVVPLLGGVVDGNAWLMMVLCPLLIAFPASAYQFWQHERLRAARDEIGRLHGELTRAHAALAQRARRDGMTGLLNRESFFGDASRLSSQDGGGALLVVDADHFKTINDRFGHPAGDAALLAIAAAMEGVLRKGDLCGRIGGEEFAIYLPGTAEAETRVIAERLRAAVAAVQFEAPDGTKVPLSVSIGGARAGPGRNFEQVMTEADRLLYKAKRRGRDRVAFAGRVVQAA